MKIRTTDELLERLDSEFGWRRKELTQIWSDVRAASPVSKPLRVRSGVAMLYAHWEGFVRQASEVYLSYVAVRRLRLDELQPGLLALALRAKLSEFHEVDNTISHAEFVAFFLNHLGDRARIPVAAAVGTKSNLNSKRLKNVVGTLGLDYGPYELKENLIDSQLLAWRNSIAHGRYQCPNEDDFGILYNAITGLMRTFKDQVSNAALLGQYRRSPSRRP
jgi:hypothetical protein